MAIGVGDYMDWIPILVSTLLFILGGIITWIVRSRIEETRAIQQKLNEERRKTYGEILLPLISVLANINEKGGKQGTGTTKAVENILSDLNKFHKNRLDLVLFGSDNVVRAHNALWEYAYKSESEENAEERGKTYMQLWGKLLLEIRKDVGNKKTSLNEFDMLRWLIRDIDKLEYL